jgi:hypothetical protein
VVGGVTGSGGQSGSGGQQRNGPKALTGDKKKEFEEAQKDALKLSDECKNNLNKVGIPANKVLDAIRSQKAFDGIASNITAGEAGLVPKDDEKWANKSVADFLQNSVRGGAYAATAIFGSDRNIVYYNTKETIFASTVFHEALHQVTGKAEGQLIQDLGASIGGLDSKLIQMGCNP